jgi:hypothetical protein
MQLGLVEPQSRTVNASLTPLEAFHHPALSVSLPQLAHLVGYPAVAAPL